MKSAVFSAILVLSACAPMQKFTPLGEISFVTPIQQWKAPDGSCVGDEICWSNMTNEQITRRMFDQSETEVFQLDQQGSSLISGSGVSVSRGQYVYSEYIIKAIVEPCDSEMPELGDRYIGVGILVQADVSVRSRRANIADIIPIAVSAEDNRLSGNFRITSWGINSDDVIVRLLNERRAKRISIESAKDAIAALRLAEALLDDDETVLEPFTFGVNEAAPGSCGLRQ